VRAFWQVNNIETGWAFLVFHQDHDRGEISIASEFGYFSYGEFVTEPVS
jgi:hypothetical protein